VRAQILATEHWSLLAARGLTWSEVMSRISIHLTVASAALVVLALMAQATGFGPEFRVMSIGLAAVVLVLGTLTELRVVNASIDDASMLLGMNRIRAAYLEIDPGLERYFVTSAHDDQAGMLATYTMGWPRSTLSHVAASTTMFVTVVNSLVAGTLCALVTDSAGGGVALVAALGVVGAVAYFAAQVEIGRRSFAHVRLPAHFPSPGGAGSDDAQPVGSDT
jgi:hypothetical protein